MEKGRKEEKGRRREVHPYGLEFSAFTGIQEKYLVKWAVQIIIDDAPQSERCSQLHLRALELWNQYGPGLCKCQTR